MKCLECDVDVKIPEDFLEGEIVSCIDCGTSYEIFRDKSGSVQIKPAKVEGEDWGE